MKNENKFILRIIILILFLVINLLTINAQYSLRGDVVNSVTNEKLPFTRIFYQENTTLTNNQGEFILKSKDFIPYIIIRALGYTSDTFNVEDTSDFHTFRLIQNSKLIPEIKIQTEINIDKYNTFTNQIKQFSKHFVKKIPAKSFFRTYTKIDSKFPAELLEAYYNVKCDMSGVQESDLKAGRFLIPKKMSFFNMSSIEMIERFNLFDNPEYSIYPLCPFSILDGERFKENFKLIVADKTPLDDQDTLIHYFIEARKSNNAFSGECYYKINSKHFNRIKLNATDVSKIPFSSIKDSLHHKIENLTYSIEISIDQFEGRSIINFIVLDVQNSMKTHDTTHLINTQSKLFIYDYNQFFFTPIMRSLIAVTDYQKIALWPYNAYFFKRNPTIVETEDEIELINQFSTIPSYNSALKNYTSIPFIPHIVEEMRRDYIFKLNLISATPKSEGLFRLNLYNEKDVKIEWDSAFISTLLYLNYDPYIDTTIVEVFPLIDYSNSYMLKEDTLTLKYFDLFRDEAVLNSYGLKDIIENTIKKKSISPKILLKCYDKFNNMNESNNKLKYYYLNSKLKLKAYNAGRFWLDMRYKGYDEYIKMKNK